MLKLTRQEQVVVLLILAGLVLGSTVKWWRHGRVPQTTAANTEKR